MDEFETLLEANRTALARWIFAHLGNHADAEDEYKDLASKMADIFGIDLSANDTEDIMEFLPQ